jgi:hypothetical protein
MNVARQRRDQNHNLCSGARAFQKCPLRPPFLKGGDFSESLPNRNLLIKKFKALLPIEWVERGT